MESGYTKGELNNNLNYISNSNQSTPKSPSNKEEFERVQKLKKRADKAFKEGKFEKAYNIYSEALEIEENDYDLIACLVGAALNLGYINEVLDKSDYLIQLDENKAQGYYLKGIANHVILQYEKAADLFLKALEFEKDHATIIVKNLIKSISKYLANEEIFQFDDNETDPITNLLKLIEVTDLLIKRRKYQLVAKILNYLQKLESDNYYIKTELLLISGKLFKLENNNDKALLAYEECFYLACLNDDNKMKIKTIVSISSCYLDANNLHKAIFYYHKLLDIETSLINDTKGHSSAELNHNYINLELRVAIRQNLFTAHYRLGKLRMCSYYLNEIIRIIDEQLKLNDISKESDHFVNTILFEFFEFIQIKMDASIELIKLYVLFKEFLLLDKLLKSMLKFVENVCEKESIESTLNEKQINSMRYFKIKCYSCLGICLAGLRNYRYSKLCTRKSLCLIDKELEKQRLLATNTNSAGVENSGSEMENQSTNSSVFSSTYHEFRLLTLLKVECLLDAVEACVQYKKAFKESKQFNDSYLSDYLDKYDAQEVESLDEIYDEQIRYAKNAYLLSKVLIDPVLRSQTTFSLAYSLYDNEFYQSAAYYFNEVLSISTLLLDKKQSQAENSLYVDVNLDYHMESTVYLSKCQLMFDYYDIGSFMKADEKKEEFDVNFEDVNDTQINKIKLEPVDVELVYKKLVKQNETITKHILKWKLHETNRIALLNTIPEMDKIKFDKDSQHLKDLYEMCNECLFYICYKLNRIDEAIMHLEKYNYLLNTDLNGFFENEKLDAKNKNESAIIEYLTNHENFKQIFIQNDQPLLIYKLLFKSKLLYTILIEPGKGITYNSMNKMSHMLNELKWINKKSIKKISDSSFDYVYKKYEKMQNDWLKLNLNYIENRDVPTEDKELRIVREKSRLKERKFFNYLYDSPADDKKRKYFDILISMNDLLKLRISEKLNEEESEQDTSRSSNNNKETDRKELIKQINKQIADVFTHILLNSIQKILIEFEAEYKNGGIDGLCVLVESKYIKMFVYTFNLNNQLDSFQLPFILIPDSYFEFSNRFMLSVRKDIEENMELEKLRDDIKSKPNRYQKINDTLDSTNSVRVLKSEIVPRNTSHPRLAVKLINQDPKALDIIIRNDHVQRAKNRLDASISTLITETISGTNSKRSRLEVIEFKQVLKPDKCCVIGCPEMPTRIFNMLHSRIKMNTFLKNGFEHMKMVAQLLYTEPIFSNKMTKTELVNQLEASNVIFLSTYSTNESDSVLICSESKEYPSSFDELDKYCKLDQADLNLIDMYRCNLLVLNCYSSIYNKPRMNLAKKFLLRGCKSVLIVLTPLPDEIIGKFYAYFFEYLKKEQSIGYAYTQAVSKLAMTYLNPADESYSTNYDLIYRMINASFCLIGTTNIKLSINEIAKSMIQTNVNKSISDIGLERNVNHLNLESKYSNITSNFSSHIEKTLNQLQILIKFLLNQLIDESISMYSFKNNTKFKDLFILLNDLITKSIYYTKSKKTAPENSDDLIDENRNAVNLLKCLGFNIQPTSMIRVRDQKDKMTIIFPDQRHLDLNVRLSHVMSSLIELCFDKSIKETYEQQQNTSTNSDLEFSSSIRTENSSADMENYDLRVKSIVYNLQALLPIEDKNLFSCLIDILALTKFSPEIALSISDFSIHYALNYYQIQNKLTSREFIHLINKDLYKWNYNKANLKELYEKSIDDSASQYTIKFSINNKVLNFLISVGFEVIGSWLRFNESDFNRKTIDILIKFLTSFAIDRDMSLYKELNINVRGQKSPAARSLIRTASNLNKDELSKKPEEEDISKFQVTYPWCSIVETTNMMNNKLKFIEKYSELSARISRERLDTLRHHVNYIIRQHSNNLRENELIKNRNGNIKNAGGQPDAKSSEIKQDTTKLIRKIKYKTGGGPSRTRVIANERFNLSLDEIEEIRKSTHFFSKMNLIQIDIERKEKVKSLLLPFIKNSNNL